MIWPEQAAEVSTLLKPPDTSPSIVHLANIFY